MYSVTKSSFADIYLPPLDKKCHKGTNGHVGIICASAGMEGAGDLCGISALRSGAGKVSLLIPENCRHFYDNRHSELMVCAKGFDFLEDFIKDKDAIVFGCGIGRCADTAQTLKRLLAVCTVPLVIDADGLYFLTSDLLASARCPVLITPHMGEASRLFGVSIEELSNKYIYYARSFAQKSNCVILLKSHFNLVANSAHCAISSFGTPALATAGSGDVLAGICGAMACRFNGDMYNCARCASFIHGFAGRISANKTSEYSVTASDISSNIFNGINKILRGQNGSSKN